MFNRYIKSLKISLGIVLLSFAVSTSAHAQFGDAGEILRAGAADANILMESYLNPFGKGFGSGMNTGWFNTAGTHKKFGFDISINAALVSVPTADQVFDLNSLNFSELEIISGPSEVATLSGESGSTTSLGIKFINPETNMEEVAEFNMPGGTGVPYVPSPMVQATLGLIKDTDVSLRFVPESEIPLLEDSNISLFGLGIKHGINQWLPGGKVLPFDLSVQYGFTNFKTSAGFSVNPKVDNETYNPYPASTWEGQVIELETKASTYNVIIGKTLPLISVYGGIGMESSKTTVATPGLYPMPPTPNPAYAPGATPGTPASFPKTIETVEAPIDLEFVNNSAFRAFAGTRIKLAILQISASYTLSTYSSFNVGFGITFR